MIARIIEFSVRNRWMVIAVWVGIAAWGLYAVLHTPVDAIPDLSENQVIVFTDWMGRSPQDIEDQVTYPLSVQLQGLAGREGGAIVERVQLLDDQHHLRREDRLLLRPHSACWSGCRRPAAALPAGVTPYLAPDATALGQIFWYTVEGDGQSLDELRAIQDWTVRYPLNSVPGVAEVASVGGFVRAIPGGGRPGQAAGVRPAAGEPLQRDRQQQHERRRQGRSTAATREYLIRGVGWLQGVDDLENVVVASRNGVPIHLKEVAKVQLGPEFRRSALEKNGREAVGGVVLMRYGENPLTVTRADQGQDPRPAGGAARGRADRAVLRPHAADRVGHPHGHGHAAGRDHHRVASRSC